MLLIAGRAFREAVRARSFRVTVVVLVIASGGGIAAVELLGGGPTEYTVATLGPVDPAVRDQLDAAAEQGGFDVEYRQEPDSGALQEAVRNGDVAAGLSGRTVYSPSGGANTFTTVLVQAVSNAARTEQLHDLGLDDADIASVQAASTVQQVWVRGATDTPRFWVGYGVGIVLYFIVWVAGMGVATAVATEKGSRISEVLLPVLRPSQLLIGTVLAHTGVMALLGVAAAVPAGAGLALLDVRLPEFVGADLALGGLWILLGFVLYVFAFAAAGALVDKVTEVSSAVAPLMTVVIVGYIVAVSVVPADPNGLAATILSIFPPTAPLAMPVRWATGTVPAWQLELAFVLTALTALGVIRAASGVYRRAITRTGHRLRWREVLTAS
jgi:ABC-2 type transport system permease protein